MPNFMYYMITCSVISCRAQQKLHTHTRKLFEVNTKHMNFVQIIEVNVKELQS
jgi:hypothetical protein